MGWCPANCGDPDNYLGERASASGEDVVALSRVSALGGPWRDLEAIFYTMRSDSPGLDLVKIVRTGPFEDARSLNTRA